MLRNSLLAVVLAVSTLFFSSVLFAADVIEKKLAPPHLVEGTPLWSFRTAISEGAKVGVNIGTKYTLVEWGCGTECQSGVIIDRTNGKIISLPVASYGYQFEKGNVALIVNPDLSEYFRVSDLMGTGKLPDWLVRQVYVVRNGCLVLALEDKTGQDLMPSDELIAEFRSPETSEVDFKPLAKPICK